MVICPDCLPLTPFPPKLQKAVRDQEANDDIRSVFPIKYKLFDSFPQLPKLRASVKNGCQMCRLLKNVIWSHVRSSPELSELAGKAIKKNEAESKGAHREIEIDIDECHNSSMSIRFGNGPDSWIPSHLSGHIRVGEVLSPLRIEMRDELRGIYYSFPSQHPLSDASIGLVQSWLEACTEKNSTLHKYCPHHIKAKAPLRLLDVMQGDAVRLIRTEGQQVQYAILSYCWGTSTAAVASRTLVSNLDDRMAGFPVQSLPPTLRESIEMIRRIGLRYIWIDGLCIVQDSDEWVTESTRMMDYYENAYFTLIPVTCSSADQGFLQPRPYWVSEIIEWPGTEKPLQFHFPSYQIPDKDIDSSTWVTRGWTFQERLLSARSVFFGAQALYYECRGGFGSEDQGFNLLPDQAVVNFFLPISSGQARDSGEWNQMDMILSKWYRCLKLYTGRQLTYESDKLLALSGITSKFKQLLDDDDTYLDGFWMKDLWNGLLWRVTNNRSDSSCTKSTLFPSWSWCCMSMTVAWPDGVATNACAELLEVRKGKQGNVRASLGVSQLVIRTWSFPVTLLNTDLSPEIDITVYMDDGSDTIDDISSVEGALGIVLTTYHHGQQPEDWKASPSATPHDLSGLVVLPKANGNESDFSYERIGTFEVARDLESVQIDNGEDDEVEWDLVPTEIENFETSAAARFYAAVYTEQQTIVLV